MVKNVPELFGCMVFNEDVMRERLPEEVYESLRKTIATGKTIDASIADPVAAAMKEWAIEKGATHYTHWFQPLTGLTAEKHDSFLSPDGPSRVVMEFSGKELIKGESDASSFPSGGLRATFEARGYTAWDPGSYAFVKDGTLYIPTAFCSYTGEALDTKTPLLRSMDAISTQGLRILRLFGDTTTKRLNTTVGAEQEYFIIDKKLYDQRKDLLYTGRTLFGAHSPKGQELEDHYFGPLKTRISEYMADLDEALWKMGIHSKTKHNEAAPAQHELAPVYVKTNLAVDNNLLIMEYMKKIAEQHGLVCLLHEKPYAGVNGSGKHNNWSLSTDTGKNLLHAGKTPQDNVIFLLTLAAIIKAVDDYQDLLRLSVAYAGNDHRLGAAEAPPAIVSIFVGEELDQIIDSIISGTSYKGAKAGMMDLGIPSIPVFRKDTTDRNRTSPFAFTGNKFEFRMLGSSQNIALPNVVLNTAVAESFRQFADRLEAAEDFHSEVAALIKETYTNHRRIIFDGNGYSYEWEKEAERRGLLNLKNAVDAFKCFNLPKNVKLFSDHGVMNEIEINSREDIFFENYSKIINIEALTMIEMASRDIIPAVNKYVGDVAAGANAKEKLIPGSCAVERDIVQKLSELTYKAYHTLNKLEVNEKVAAAIPNNVARAEAYRDTVIPVMARLREFVDEMEKLTSSDYWPMPSYGDMMFKV
ncbi:MAG: glutamine synthetase type III [Ruminococcaceae bacterium]|nr:glutamine synthetase type III [Oscillospiraceae bacterium]